MKTTGVNRRPRVVIFHPHFTLAGGAGNVALEEARRLADEFEVVVLCLRVASSLRALFSDVHFVELGGPLSGEVAYWLSLPNVQRRIHRVVRDLQPDILLPHVFPANWWALLYRCFHNIPCVWYCHEPSAFVHSDEVLTAVPVGLIRTALRITRPALQVFDRWLVRRAADTIIVNSRYTAGEVERIYGRSADVIIHPGVDLSYFVPGQHKQPYLLMAGRLTAYKRVHKAIEILPHLRHTNLRLVLAGDGEERENLEQIARQLGVSDRVEFFGDVALQARAELYGGALLGLALREWESFGMFAAESLACGTPVIAVNSGGLREIVQDGVNGLFVPDDTPQSIAQTIDRLLDDPVLYETLCRNARPTAECFSWERHIQQVRQVLKQALDRQAG